jgi:hypothetical protein
MAGAKPTRQNSSLSEAPLTGLGKSSEVQTDETGHEMVFEPIPGILSRAKRYLRRSTASEEAKKRRKIQGQHKFAYQMGAIYHRMPLQLNQIKG